MSESKIVHATEASFADDVLAKSNEMPVLVDFWAEWCGPCQAVAPVLDELAANYYGRLHVVKVDVDSNAAAAATYSVSGIPSVLVFKGGKEVDRVVGALQMDAYEKFFKPYLA